MEEIDSKENLIRLTNQYQNLIFSICLKFTGDYFAAEDLTQETFLGAYQHLSEFGGDAEEMKLIDTYLSDEELEQLIADIEQKELVVAPPDLMEDILERMEVTLKSSEAVSEIRRHVMKKDSKMYRMNSSGSLLSMEKRFHCPNLLCENG